MGKQALDRLSGIIGMAQQSYTDYQDKKKKAAKELYEQQQKEEEKAYQREQDKLARQDIEANRKFREEEASYKREQDKSKEYSENRKLHQEMLNKTAEMDLKDEQEQRKNDLAREAMRYRLMSKLPASQRMQMEAQDQLEGQNILSSAFDPSESDALMEASQNQKQIEDEAAWASAMKKKMDLDKINQIPVQYKDEQGNTVYRKLSEDDYNKLIERQKSSESSRALNESIIDQNEALYNSLDEKGKKLFLFGMKNKDTEKGRAVLQGLGYSNQQTK